MLNSERFLRTSRMLEKKVIWSELLLTKKFRVTSYEVFLALNRMFASTKSDTVNLNTQWYS